MDDIRGSFARHGLSRPRDDRFFAGVCSGIGRRLGLRPWPARWLFLLVLLLIPGSQLLVYPVLWVLMPQEEDAAAHGSWTPTPAA